MSPNAVGVPIGSRLLPLKPLNRFRIVLMLLLATSLTPFAHSQSGVQPTDPISLFLDFIGHKLLTVISSLCPEKFI